MKPAALLTPLALLGILALALAGCTSMFTAKSERHVIVPAGTPGADAYWTPTEDDIRRLEEKLAGMFFAADARISGLPDNIPPYPLNEYLIRYTGAGPAGNRYILGEAKHKSLPDAAKFLDTPSITMPGTGDARHFTVMYDMQSARIVAVRFLTQ